MISALEVRAEMTEKDLLDTALKISKMEKDSVSDMVQRAINAFEKGNVALAKELLDEVAHEAENHFRRMESQQELVHQDIDALLLQAKTIMADAATPIDERREQTLSIYKKADLWAEKSVYDKEKYDELLGDYFSFLRKCGNYKQAFEILKRECELSIVLYGAESEETAWSYCSLGGICYDLGGKEGYLQSLDYFDRGIQISEKIGNNEQQCSVLYNNKALVLEALCRYKEALYYYLKAAAIDEKVYGKNHRSTAVVYGNIANIYDTLEENDEAEKYFANDEARKCKATEYAVKNGAFVSGSDFGSDEGYSVWWLRSPDPDFGNNVSYVNYGGGFAYGGVYYDSLLARPALWINL